MKKNIIKILREDWSRREWDVHQTYEEYKREAFWDLLRDVMNAKLKSPKQTFKLASIDRIKKIWTDYSKTGFVRDERGIDEIGEIFVRNIAMLAINTEIAGHTPNDPKYMYDNYYGGDNEKEEKKFNKLLDSDRLWDYIEDYNGQLRISDYGLPRLETLAFKFLAKDKTYEEKLITLDMMLNVVHQRSDLSRLFVQGGSASLDILFTNESIMKNLIKQKVSEALILKLDKENGNLVVVSNETDEKKASQETFRSKEILKSNNFKWNGDIRAWITPMENFDSAKELLAKINKSNEFINKIEDLELFVKNTQDFNGKSNLMDKITTYVNDLANVTDEKTLSAEIRRYLTFFSKFRGHSFYNTMLIFIQKPDATRVAGFRQWETKFFRKVVKGAKGILIFAPIFAKKSNEPENTDDKDLDKEIGKGSPVRFKPVYVFDISDTEKIDERGEIPEQPKWFLDAEPSELAKELYEYVKEVVDDMGIKTTTSDTQRGERGYSSGDHINMTSSVEAASDVSTLVHELAHELMHWKKTSIYYQGDETRMDRALVELQAESVAYVVMKHYGLPVTHQPTYIALWKGNKEKILSNLKVISDVASFIIQAIDNVAARHKVNEDLYL